MKKKLFFNTKIFNQSVKSIVKSEKKFFFDNDGINASTIKLT